MYKLLHEVSGVRRAVNYPSLEGNNGIGGGSQCIKGNVGDIIS